MQPLYQVKRLNLVSLNNATKHGVGGGPISLYAYAVWQYPSRVITPC